MRVRVSGRGAAAACALRNGARAGALRAAASRGWQSEERDSLIQMHDLRLSCSEAERFSKKLYQSVHFLRVI